MGYQVDLIPPRPFSADEARDIFDRQKDFVQDSEDPLRGRLRSARSPIWFEGGRICSWSPCSESMHWLFEIAEQYSATLVGEDGAQIQRSDILQEVGSLIRSMNEDPAPISAGIAQMLADLTDPIVPEGQTEEPLDAIRSLEAEARRPAAAYLYSRAVECAGTPEDRVFDALAMLSDVAEDWLAYEGPPLERFCPEVRRRAKRLG